MNKWFFASLLAAFNLQATAAQVKVVPDEAHQRVSVTVDGKAFTAYVWPGSLKKPVLYPLITADGIDVTRGYPLAPRAGERTDHPHHAGLWFNYGNVNGYDFWNNSDAIPEANRDKMGTIREKGPVSVKSGTDRGELTAHSIWTTGAGQDLLQQTTNYVFSQKGTDRAVDEIITLHALDKVVFHDDKEGLLGIRVARWLESPDEKGGTFTDANGKPTEVAPSNLPGATGVYLTSEGKKAGAAWGTRGRWCALTGKNPDGKEVTIVIFDHPKNPNYPTYWHARGYGLFAANPLGQHIFDPKAPELDYTLEKGKDAIFTYRVLLLSGPANAEELDKRADDFAAEYH